MAQQIKLTCKRCGHSWVRRRFDGLPQRCPHCKSPYWNTDRTAKWARVLEAKKKAIEAGEDVAPKWRKILGQ